MIAPNFPPLLGEGQGGVASVRTIKLYSPQMVRRSRDLRKNPTDAEKKLWRLLRGNQMDGYKFRRQFPIDAYIADFVCVEAKLVIEADGSQHSENHYDAKRDTIIRKHGYTILRFWNNDILNDSDGVIESIRNSLLSTQTPPQPSPGRGGSNIMEAQ